MLRRSVIFEIRRAFGSTGTKVSFVLGNLIVFLDLFAFCQQYGAPEQKILIQAWIGTDFQFAYNSLFYIVMPLIACLPFAGSYYQDISDGYDKNLCIHISRKQYLVAKCIAVYVSSFVSVSFPLLANLFVVAGLYPNFMPEKLTFLSAAILDRDRFSLLFHEYPVFYCLVFILIAGFFAGTLGLISVAFAKYCKSQFTAVTIPFVFYILTGVLMVNRDGRSIAVMEIVNPLQRYATTTKQMCGVYLFLTISSFFVIWLLGRKRDIL